LESGIKNRVWREILPSLSLINPFLLRIGRWSGYTPVSFRGIGDASDRGEWSKRGNYWTCPLHFVPAGWRGAGTSWQYIRRKKDVILDKKPGTKAVAKSRGATIIPVANNCGIKPPIKGGQALTKVRIRKWVRG